MPRTWDAIVIGSGPNGLSAAASLARRGYSVLILEASSQIGGGVRTAPLTLPGFRHDTCSAIHPMAVNSPGFRDFPLERHGLAWVHPGAPLAHPLDGGRAILLERSLAETVAGLGSDGESYGKLFSPAVAEWGFLTGMLAGRFQAPHAPFGLLRFAITGLRPAVKVLQERFETEPARALFAGLGGHSNLPLEDPLTAGFALVLGASGHAVGWPFPRGGAGNLSGALASYLRSLGAGFETGVRVNSIEELPASRIVLCDLSPRELLRIAGSRFPGWYRSKLEKYQYGPAAFKLDWALDAPIPWAAAECARAGTVHLGGTAKEIAESERAVGAGRSFHRPFTILAQHTLFDPSRAPQGKHTAWAYCHVPNGSTEDMTECIEGQIERFAPGFRDRILARSITTPSAFEARNPNLVGGDFCSGANHWWQTFTRPTFLTYLTPDRRILICSAATPPGGGVHGISGYVAARIAQARLPKAAGREAETGMRPAAVKVGLAALFAAGVVLVAWRVLRRPDPTAQR